MLGCQRLFFLGAVSRFPLYLFLFTTLRYQHNLGQKQKKDAVAIGAIGFHIKTSFIIN